MRSIYAKILLWSLGTFALSLAVFAAFTFTDARRGIGPIDFFQRTFVFIEEEACRSYEQGGPARLAGFLDRLNTYYGAEHFLTDPHGRDLVDGGDHSALLTDVTTFDGPPRRSGDREILARSLRDGRYRFFVVLDPRRGPRAILPYFGAVVLVIAVLGYILAIHLVSPLRRLREAVDRFGKGDLSARDRSTRKDEIGELSRAFDEMAGQIETLRAAELRLLQDVSHELRSPLARFGFNLELARTGTVEDREVAFGRVKKDFDRLSTLVDELLQLTCAEGDPSSRNQQEVRLDGLLGDLAEDCAPEAEAKGCRLAVRMDGAAGLTGDRELLRRAIENVMRNAIRHAPEGTPVEVDLSRHSGIATISVRDHGPGVPEESLEAIFRPFFRIGDDRSRSSGGAGLGLSIARRSIELHQGYVGATHARPGLRVTIGLPVSSNGEDAPSK
ncbi:MAG: sensor histidine kinase [Isosphaeraceae bacterium]